jgi:hypothetical protein
MTDQSSQQTPGWAPQPIPEQVPQPTPDLVPAPESIPEAVRPTPDPAFRRRLLIAGGVIVAILVIVGVVQGFLWAWVAPGEQVKVFADGSYGALPTADFHPFVDLALFVLFGIAAGLVAGAAAWQVRSIRGVGALLAVVVGSALGAALAYWIGPAVVSGVDPATVGATGHDQIVVQAPRLSTPLVMVAQPAFAAAVYTFLAAWNGRSDLGRVEPNDTGLASRP